MPRVPLSDKSGNWFDPDECKMWKDCPTYEEVHRRIQENQDRNGQYVEEFLYFTKDSLFILQSEYHCLPEEARYTLIDQEKAARWLIVNGYHDELRKLELQAEANRLKL